MTFIYDHGVRYIPEAKTFQLNLDSSAILTDETKSRHSLREGYVSGIQVTLDPITIRYEDPSKYWLPAVIEEKQLLKVTGHQAQQQDEFAIVEWFYSNVLPTDKQIPKVIHQLRFIVVGRNDEQDLEEYVVKDENNFTFETLTVRPSSSRGVRTNSVAPEYEFFFFAFQLIDKTKDLRMVRDFEIEVNHAGRTGRIDWNRISDLGQASEQLSYLLALNKIQQKVKDRFFLRLISQQNLRDLIALANKVIKTRQRQYSTFSNDESFNKRSHRHMINIWMNLTKDLESLFEDILPIIQNAKDGVKSRRDDICPSVVDTKFTSTATITDWLIENFTKLIIPIFILLNFLYFWNR